MKCTYSHSCFWSPNMDHPALEISEGTSPINTVKNNKKKKMNIKMIISQNFLGLKRAENNDEFFHNLWQRRPFATLLQETWLTGDDTFESEGYTLIFSGISTEKQSHRGSQGVVIKISSQAMTVCGKSGMEIGQISARVIAIYMMITDHQKREKGLVLMSAYAPIGVDSDEAWTSFLIMITMQLSNCVKQTKQYLLAWTGTRAWVIMMEMYAVLLEYHIIMTHGKECTTSCQSGPSPQPPLYSIKKSMEHGYIHDQNPPTN